MKLPRLLMFAVLGVILAAFHVRADDGPALAVRDEAGLFSPEAVRQATAELDGIRDIYHLDFIIETLAAPPEDVAKQLKEAKRNDEKERILNAWGAQRAAAAGGEAVHILIGKDVAHGWFGKIYGCVVVTVPPNARNQEFTDADALTLHNQLRWLNSGKSKVKNDAILLTAVARVRENLRYKNEPGFPWLGISSVMAGMLGLWGVLGLAHLRLRAADATAAPPEAQRLGLYHALLGGMFGSVAGHWIYDSLFVAASRSTQVAPSVLESPAPAAAEMEQAVQGEAAESPPPTKAERLDLAARDHPTEEEPAPATTRL